MCSLRTLRVLIVSLLLASYVDGQSVCDDFGVVDNTLTLTAEKLEDLETDGISLQDVVDCVEEGGSVLFSVASYQVKETLDIRKNINFASEARTQRALVCNGVPIFSISGATVEISNLDIRDCELDDDNAPLVIGSGSDVILKSVGFLNNKNNNGSAAIQADAESSITIEKSQLKKNNGRKASVLVAGRQCNVRIVESEFENNEGRGSVLVLEDIEDLTISNSSFLENVADRQEGAAIRVSSKKEASVLLTNGCRFENNIAGGAKGVNDGNGGALHVTGNVNVTVEKETSFIGNQAAGRGGAIFLSASSTFTVSDAFFTSNVAKFAGGGAIYGENANGGLRFDISSTVFSQNSALNYLGSGGALRFQGGKVTGKLTDSVSFLMNEADLDGGGLYVANGANVEIANASFVGNEALNGGGASIYIVSLQRTRSATMVVSIAETTFLFNRALYSNRGGGNIGIAGFGSELTITDSYFGQNDGGKGAGGAIYLFGGPIVSVSGSIFQQNKAIWGGALYAENDARFDISESKFSKNTAEQGGAILTRGDVDVLIDKCEFRKNAAVNEGGAIKVRNYKSSGDELAKFQMKNCIVSGNEAGFNLFEDKLYGTVTTGGAILAEGSGVDLALDENLFEGNHGSEGGALCIHAVAECNIAENNRFLENGANFGGAIYMVLDEEVRPTALQYNFVKSAEFTNNSAESEGGAMYLVSSKTSSDALSLSARHFILAIQNSSFTDNKAHLSGGAVAVVGSGVKIQEKCTFRSNSAVVNALDAENREWTRGGGLHIEKGGAVDCSEARFKNNTADLGGGVFIQDASLEADDVHFTKNYASSRGAGGAVGVEVARGRDIPVLNSANRLRNVIFQCSECEFRENNGSQWGGALSLHDMDPNTTFSLDNDCTNENQNEIETGEDELTCPTYLRFLARLKRRTVRFYNTTFIKNSARAGGAIFTNNPLMINVTKDIVSDNGERIDLVQLNKSSDYLKQSGIVFRGNSNFRNGYGEDYATTPVEAYLLNKNVEEAKRSEERTFTNKAFLSGERLEFDVSFVDGIGQGVSFDLNITARITWSKNQSTGQELEISGQQTAEMEADGKMRFTGTRLRGAERKEYHLKVEYTSESVLQTLSVKSSDISITIRPCGVGEIRRNVSGDLIECDTCGQETFAWNSSAKQCTVCRDVDGLQCFGKTVIPIQNYWHATSYSLTSHKCIGHDACDLGENSNTIKAVTEKAHDRGERQNYTDDPMLCNKGYEGIICGHCADGYGREGHRCSKCASTGLRVFLLTTLILWSFIFLSLFLRSVMQLGKRIEIIKKFKMAPTEFRRRFMETIPTPDISSADEAVASQLMEGIELTERTGGPSATTARGLFPKAAANAPSSRPAPQKLESHQDRLQSLRPNGDVQGGGGVTRPTGNNAGRGATAGHGKRGRLTQRLQEMASGVDDSDLEALTLANPVSEILKILVNFLQVTAVAAAISVDWTDSVRRTVVTLGLISSVSSGSGYLSLDCYMSSSSPPKSIRRLSITVLYPLMMFCAYAVFWALTTVTTKQNRRYFSQRVWLTYLAINYFVYIGMTKNLLRFFACAHITDDQLTDLDRYVWEEDSAVECFRDDHALAVGLLVVPLLLCVTVMFPVGTFVILHRNKDRLNDEKFVATYGFLYRAYDKHYWEVVIMLRKGVIATVAVFAYRLQENLQGLLCILVLVAALSFHLTMQPFTQEIPQLNYLETLSLSTTIIVFVSGLMMNDSNTEGVRPLLSSITILIVVVTVIVMLIELVVACQEVIDMKLIELEKMDISTVMDSRLSKKLETLFLHYWELLQRTLRALVQLGGRLRAAKEAPQEPTSGTQPPPPTVAQV